MAKKKRWFEMAGEEREESWEKYQRVLQKLEEANERIARQLRRARIESKMTLRELSEKTGLSDSHLSRLERDITKISARNLWLINSVFCRDYNYYFEEG